MKRTKNKRRYTPPPTDYSLLSFVECELIRKFDLCYLVGVGVLISAVTAPFQLWENLL